MTVEFALKEDSEECAPHVDDDDQSVGGVRGVYLHQLIRIWKRMQTVACFKGGQNPFCEIGIQQSNSIKMIDN